MAELLLEIVGQGRFRSVHHRSRLGPSWWKAAVLRRIAAIATAADRTSSSENSLLTRGGSERAIKLIEIGDQCVDIGGGIGQLDANLLERLARRRSESSSAAMVPNCRPRTDSAASKCALFGDTNRRRRDLAVLRTVETRSLRPSTDRPYPCSRSIGRLSSSPGSGITPSADKSTHRSELARSEDHDPGTQPLESVVVMTHVKSTEQC